MPGECKGCCLSSANPKDCCVSSVFCLSNPLSEHTRSNNAVAVVTVVT